MNASLRKYDHNQDFLRVRDLLVDTYSLLDKPVNWRLERWNYARYHVIPVLGAYAKDSATADDGLEAISQWEDKVRIWETDEGEIAAVTALEYPWAGDVFFLRHPDYDLLLEEMFEDAEQSLLHPGSKTLQVNIYEHDEALQAVALGRGYQKNSERFDEDTEYAIGDRLPEIILPEGFSIQSMADNNDLDRRRKAFGRGFNHEDPKEWPSLFAYQELQRAPDYRKELDLSVVAPDGEFVSFCILWWDQANRMGILEPVGTVPEYRRKGLARAVIYEAFHRAAALGAERVVVGAGIDFYLAIGFKKTMKSYVWIKEL